MVRYYRTCEDCGIDNRVAYDWGCGRINKYNCYQCSVVDDDTGEA